MVYSTERSKAVVPVLVLLFVALWFSLRGDLLYVLSCIIVFLCFSVLLALRLPRLGKRELILVLFVRLFDLRLFGFVCFLFLLVRFVIVALLGLFLLPSVFPNSSIYQHGNKIQINFSTHNEAKMRDRLKCKSRSNMKPSFVSDAERKQLYLSFRNF